MPPDLEPASALAVARKVLNACAYLNEDRLLLRNYEVGAVLIESDRASVREPLERRIAELLEEVAARELLISTDLQNAHELVMAQQRIASLEAQLATARGEVLREAADTIAALNSCDYSSDANIGEARGLTRAEQAVRALLTSPPKSPWIRTAEQPPKPSEWVTVANYDGVVQRVAWRLLNTGWWECDLEEFDCAPPGTFAHWTPLPPPPTDPKGADHG